MAVVTLVLQGPLLSCVKHSPFADQRPELHSSLPTLSGIALAGYLQG